MGNAEKLISIKKCREVMAEHGIEYTEEELFVIRDFLFRIIEMSKTQFDKLKENETIPLYEDSKSKTPCIPLHPREYRRAS